MIKIPPNNQWVQPNINDKSGSIWSSMNLDLISNQGALRVSPRTIITTDDITDLDIPIGFVVFTDVANSKQYCWCVSGKYVWRMNLISGYSTAFAKDVATGTPSGTTSTTSCSSDVSDIWFSGKDWMTVTTNDDVYRFNPSTGQWNDGNGELGSGVHMLTFFAGRFYVIASVGQKIYSFLPANYNALTTSSSNSLNIANKGYNVTSLTFLRTTSSKIWAGSINQSKNGCYIFAWDGVTADDPNETYFVSDASGVLACVIKNDSPWVIDNNGRLLYFNGGSFVEAKNGRLPIKKDKFLKNSLSAINDRWIHPNGMQIVDGRINVLINNEYKDSGATIEENIPSGIWEYDPTVGWYHKMSLSLYASSVIDYGQNRISRVGALYANKDDSGTNGTMLIGAQLFSDATATKEVILIDDSNDTVQKYGYLVTPKIFSAEIQDEWQKFYIRNKKLLDSTDSITVKYRVVSDVAPTSATITWTSTTTFTTTTNVTAFVGYEVEVLQGKGSGKCAKILSVVNNAGTYTVTVDSVYTGCTSGTAKARFQYWVQIGIYTSQTRLSQDFLVGVPSTWIQFKICMQFTGSNQIDNFVLTNKTHQSAV